MNLGFDDRPSLRLERDAEASRIIYRDREERLDLSRYTYICIYNTERKRARDKRSEQATMTRLFVNADVAEAKI